MDHIDVPSEQVIPLDTISEGVQGLRILFVNIFGIAHSNGGWTLIDAAIPYSETMISSWAEKQFRTPPNAIVLTHGHFDHVSAAAALAKEWDVPIYAHRDEFPYLTGKREYAKPNIGAGGGLMSLLSPIYPRGPVHLGNRLRELVISTDLSVAELPGWQAIHTPGHTPGHVSFFRPNDRVLLPGDAFCTTKPESFFEAALAQQPELHGPPAYFTSDWEIAQISVQRLSRLRPTTVAPGHGKPLTGEIVTQALLDLAANFDAVAIPENRKPQEA